MSSARKLVQIGELGAVVDPSSIVGCTVVPHTEFFTMQSGKLGAYVMWYYAVLVPHPVFVCRLGRENHGADKSRTIQQVHEQLAKYGVEIG